MWNPKIASHYVLNMSQHAGSLVYVAWFGIYQIGSLGPPPPSVGQKWKILYCRGNDIGSDCLAESDNAISSFKLTYNMLFFSESTLWHITFITGEDLDASTELTWWPAKELTSQRTDQPKNLQFRLTHKSGWVHMSARCSIWNSRRSMPLLGRDDVQTHEKSPREAKVMALRWAAGGLVTIVLYIPSPWWQVQV